MTIGFACAAAMLVALGGSGATVLEGLSLLLLSFSGGWALSDKLDAIAQAVSRE